MSNALVKYDDIHQIATSMAQSGFFSDAKEVNKAIVKIIAGQEIGLGAFSSMTGIHIIQGKPTLGANVIATLIKNDDRYDYKLEELTDRNCKVSFYENGEKVGESSFSFEDAEAASLHRKDVWKKYPRNMLFSRAISNGARWFAAGIFGGMPMYTPEELGGEVDEEGNYIDAEARDVTAEQPISMLSAGEPKVETTTDVVVNPDPIPEYTEEDIGLDKMSVESLVKEGFNNLQIKEKLNLPLPKVLEYRKELGI